MATDPSSTNNDRYPKDGYDPEHPYNQVKVQYPNASETQDDGTPGKERRRWAHMPSGTNKEVKWDGTTAEMHTANHNVYIKGGLTHSICGKASKSGGGSSEKSQKSSNSPNGPGRSIGGNDDYMNQGGTCEKKGGPHSKNIGKKAGEYKTIGDHQSTIVGGHKTSTVGGDRTTCTVGGSKDLCGGERTNKTDGPATYTHKGGVTHNNGSSRNPGNAYVHNHHGHHVERGKGNHTQTLKGNKKTKVSGSHDTNAMSRAVQALQSIAHSAGSSASYSGGSSASLSSGGSTSVSGSQTSVSGSQSVSISSGSGGSGGGMSASSNGASMGQGNTSVAANSTQVTTNGNVVANGTVTLGNTIFKSTVAYQGYDLQSALVNNFFYVVANTVSQVVLNISGSFGKGTITMPPAPVDGQHLGVTAANTITTLAINANSGQAVLGAPTTMAANTPFSFQWINSIATWFRV